MQKKKVRKSNSFYTINFNLNRLGWILSKYDISYFKYVTNKYVNNKQSKSQNTNRSPL